jgi:hypothetical protein
MARVAATHKWSCEGQHSRDFRTFRVRRFCELNGRIAPGAFIKCVALGSAPLHRPWYPAAAGGAAKWNVRWNATPDRRPPIECRGTSMQARRPSTHQVRNTKLKDGGFRGASRRPEILLVPGSNCGATDPSDRFCRPTDGRWTSATRAEVRSVDYRSVRGGRVDGRDCVEL